MRLQLWHSAVVRKLKETSATAKVAQCAVRRARVVAYAVACAVVAAFGLKRNRLVARVDKRAARKRHIVTAIAGVAVAVAVRILLMRIVHRRTVVADVRHVVAVLIDRLWQMVDRRAVGRQRGGRLGGARVKRRRITHAQLHQVRAVEVSRRRQCQTGRRTLDLAERNVVRVVDRRRDAAARAVEAVGAVDASRVEAAGG